ncbi:MAG: CotH kinase family protein [Glaciecola sp.]|nr:CotH kinase family protein [Glaciecola sp.]
MANTPTTNPPTTNPPFYSFCMAMTVILFLSISPNAIAQQSTTYLDDASHQFWHDDSTLSAITISFSQAQWDLLLQSSANVRNEVSATMQYEHLGVTYTLDNIGVKLSGNTSFVLPINSNGNLIQANYTLDFDEFVDDQALQGIAALKLKRFKDDSTFVREPLSNRIMQNFGIFTVHSSTHVKVFLQIANQASVYTGIYRLNESVNRKEYIDKRFASDNDSGFLWQGNYKAFGPALFSRITADWDGVADRDDASFEYKGKGSQFDEAHEQLVRLATNFTQLEGTEFHDYVARHINMELFLKSMAAEAVLGHWDGFWGNANNYLFYIDEQEVLHYIPYDTDNTLGTSLLMDDSGEQSTINFGQSNNTPMLVTKILQIDEYRQQFLRHTYELVTGAGLMVETDALTYINTVHQLIDADLNNVTNQNNQIADRPAGWANQGDYRLYDFSTGRNWYRTRKTAVERFLPPPNANAGENITVTQGETIGLNASASTSDFGDIVSYTWSTGATGVSPQVSFADAGFFVVTLTVVDSLGLSSNDTVNVTVNAAPAVVTPTPTPTPSPTPTPEPAASSGSSLPLIPLGLLGLCVFIRRFSACKQC